MGDVSLSRFPHPVLSSIPALCRCVGDALLLGARAAGAEHWRHTEEGTRKERKARNKGKNRDKKMK